MNKKVKLSKDIDEKIKYINKVNNDACRYLSNIYTRYYLCDDTKDIGKYLNYNKCMFQGDILEIAKYCKVNNCIILEITKTYDSRYRELISICKDIDIPIITVTNENIKYLYKNIKNYKYDSIFFDINVSDIDSWYNWNIVIENNFNNILLNFDRFNLEELKIDTINKVEECNTKSEKGKYEKSIGGFNVVKVIKLLQRLICLKNIKNDMVANIYTNDNKVNSYYIEELSEIIGVLTYSNSINRYDYIYDLLCKKLERDISRYNYCIFRENKCIAQRNNAKWPKNEYDGCCFDISKNKDCEYLNANKSCNITCISCRLFTCRYLKGRGIDYDIRKSVFCNTFFNLLQKPVLIWNFFTPKHKILNSVKRYRIVK